MDAKDMENAGEEIVKKKKGGKQASIELNNTAKKDDVKRIMGNLMEWYKQTPIKTDDECAVRLEEFFTTCFARGEIPTVEKMCLALGYGRTTVWEWEAQASRGNTRANMIKKAKELLASFDAQMVTEGKINPVVYIFRAKNYFGLQDKQEYVLTPNNPLGDITNPAEIQKKLEAGIVDDNDE
jgi:hypothetical protein